MSMKAPSLRAQLNRLTVVQLKDILRSNHQNPFGRKAELLTRIVYLVKHGGYPSCPKCSYGRLKVRLYRRKGESKYYCPGYPVDFRVASYYRCDYVTDQCEKETFEIPSKYNIKQNK